MSDPTEFIEATFKGCAENVGPLISLDLEVGEASCETTSDLPEGDLAVLPMSSMVDDEEFASLTLSSPIHELVSLGRRMLGDEEPDKERDLGEEDLDAVGEVLNLMSGAVDQSMRSHVNADVRTAPLPWWRSSDPGENAFGEGEQMVARTTVTVPGGGAISLVLRMPLTLLDTGASAEVSRRDGCVVLIGLDDETTTAIQKPLESARMEVVSSPMEDGINDIVSGADLILIGGSDEESLALVRELRLHNETWSVPTILCAAEPTRETVIRALTLGAYHVYRLGGDDMTLLRTLNAAREVNE